MVEQCGGLAQAIHNYARTQLIVMSHAAGINYERAEKRAKVKYDAEHSDGTPEQKGFVKEGSKYIVGQEGGLKFGETPTKAYEDFMRAQGIPFKRIYIEE